MFCFLVMSKVPILNASWKWYSLSLIDYSKWLNNNFSIMFLSEFYERVYWHADCTQWKYITVIIISQRQCIYLIMIL